MISSRVLDDILEKPLGPYRDHCILRETCQMKSGTRLVLYSFVLEHNGRVTGLDESERPLNGPDNRKFRFRGLLKIADPDWLSDDGLKTIEDELNLRIRVRALCEGERVPPQPLTLEGLFGCSRLARSDDATWPKDDETKLMVKIQGEKNMPAVFMSSDVVPNGLLWTSKTHNRNYEVATMDVETYSLSQNFFWRWRLVALMKKICAKYPYVHSRRRTPGWYIEKYLAEYACTPEHQHRRLIYDEDDSDMDDKGKTVTPRFLRKPHMSEILGLFATHAEWLITNNEVRRNKLFDIGSWESFAVNAKIQRREAATEGVRWGWPEGKKEDETSSDEYEDAGRMNFDTDRLVRENPVIGKSNMVLDRKLQRARAKAKREYGQKRLVVSSDSASDQEVPRGPEYVSDFSEPTDSEREDDSDRMPADVEALDQIPWQLKLPPQLPDVDGRWWCPSKGCDYHINLHKLKEEDIKGVQPDRVRHIQQKQWQNAPYNEEVLKGFRSMVSNHYVKHFEECGVKVEKVEEKASRCSCFLRVIYRLTVHGLTTAHTIFIRQYKTEAPW
ncbi:hypothetical protein JVU11DRAFT_3447 [Chiua virens]|nr:hypothetical protein JVU11DRAFT_3447 [Chiua virens]